MKVRNWPSVSTQVPLTYQSLAGKKNLKELGGISMLSTDFDYSDFCQSLIIGSHDADIEIFRESGTFA